MANTKSAEKAARQSTAHRARNDALTSQLRSAIRKATLALKAGKQDDAAAALAHATPDHRQHGQQGHHSPQQGRAAQEPPDQAGSRAREVASGAHPASAACAGGLARMLLQVAHHRLLELIGAGAGGA